MLNVRIISTAFGIGLSMMRGDATQQNAPETGMAHLQSEPALAWAMSLNPNAIVDLKSRTIRTPKRGNTLPVFWHCDRPAGSKVGQPVESQCFQRNLSSRRLYRWVVNIDDSNRGRLVTGFQPLASNHIFQFGNAWPKVLPRELPAGEKLGAYGVSARCNLDTQSRYAFTLISFRSALPRKEVIHALRSHLATLSPSVDLQSTSFTATLKGRFILELSWTDPVEGGGEYALRLVSVP